MHTQYTCDYCGHLYDRTPAKRGRFCSRQCTGARRRGPQQLLSTRVMLHVAITETCWLWTGYRGTNGYGNIQIDKRPALVHRVAWELASGAPIPDGLVVGHVCDTRNCVRNDDAGTYEVGGVLLPRFGHLFLGTTAHNSHDMTAKGRSLTGARNPARQHPERLARGEQNGAYTRPSQRPRGSAHGNAKLTEGEVREIRARYTAGATLSALARSYQVSVTTIVGIVHRQTWQHV